MQTQSYPAAPRGSSPQSPLHRAAACTGEGMSMSVVRQAAGEGSKAVPLESGRAGNCGLPDCLIDRLQYTQTHTHRTHMQIRSPRDKPRSRPVAGASVLYQELRLTYHGAIVEHVARFGDTSSRVPSVRASLCRTCRAAPRQQHSLIEMHDTTPKKHTSRRPPLHGRHSSVLHGLHHQRR